MDRRGAEWRLHHRRALAAGVRRPPAAGRRTTGRGPWVDAGLQPHAAALAAHATAAAHRWHPLHRRTRATAALRAARRKTLAAGGLQLRERAGIDAVARRADASRRTAA